MTYSSSGCGGDRVIALRHNRSDPLDNRVLEDSFSKAFDRLTYDHPLACVHTGMEFEPVCPPDAVILDVSGSLSYAIHAEA